MEPSQSDHQQKCSCGRATVQFECIKEDCPNYQTQKFYCQQCLFDFKNHNHKPDQITAVNYIKEVQERWQKIY